MNPSPEYNDSLRHHRDRAVQAFRDALARAYKVPSEAELAFMELARKLTPEGARDFLANPRTAGQLGTLMELREEELRGILRTAGAEGLQAHRLHSAIRWLEQGKDPATQEILERFATAERAQQVSEDVRRMRQEVLDAKGALVSIDAREALARTTAARWEEQLSLVFRDPEQAGTALREHLGRDARNALRELEKQPTRFGALRTVRRAGLTGMLPGWMGKTEALARTSLEPLVRLTRSMHRAGLAAREDVRWTAASGQTFIGSEAVRAAATEQIVDRSIRLGDTCDFLNAVGGERGSRDAALAAYQQLSPAQQKLVPLSAGNLTPLYMKLQTAQIAIQNARSLLDPDR